MRADRKAAAWPMRPGAWIREGAARRGLAAAVALPCLALCACSAPPPAIEDAAPVQERRTDWSTFNIRDVFPEGAGRELVLDNCQSCHVLVPILVLSLDEAAWYRSGLEHRERVEGLSDSEFEQLYEYLSTNFTPDRPVPGLPPALLDSWTTY